MTNMIRSIVRRASTPAGIAAVAVACCAIVVAPDCRRPWRPYVAAAASVSAIA